MAVARRAEHACVTRHDLRGGAVAMARSVRQRSMRLNALALAVAVAIAGRVDAQTHRLEPECPPARDSFRLSHDPLQQAAIAGEVTKRDTGRPLRNAFVLLTPGDHRATTDSLGAFRIADVPEGRYMVLIRHIGFEKYADTLLLGTRLGAHLHVPLVPAYLDRCPTVRRVPVVPALPRVPSPHRKPGGGTG